jgi:hypothetical protein
MLVTCCVCDVNGSAELLFSAGSRQSIRRPRRVARLPRPTGFGLHLESNAEEGTDQDDRAQHPNAAERGGYGHSADDVSGHEELQAQEDGPT